MPACESERVLPDIVDAAITQRRSSAHATFYTNHTTNYPGDRTLLEPVDPMPDRMLMFVRSNIE
jgi:hypothetical protein